MKIQQQMENKYKELQQKIRMMDKEVNKDYTERNKLVEEMHYFSTLFPIKFTSGENVNIKLKNRMIKAKIEKLEDRVYRQYLIKPIDNLYKEKIIVPEEWISRI